MRSRKRLLLGVFVGTLLAASTALAAWLVIGTIEGEGETTAGSATAQNLTLGVAFTGGNLTPTASPTAVELTVKNTTSLGFKVTAVRYKVTIASEVGCPLASFETRVKGSPLVEAEWKPVTSSEVEAKAEASGITVGSGLSPVISGVELRVASGAPVACAGDGIKVHASATHT